MALLQQDVVLWRRHRLTFVCLCVWTAVQHTQYDIVLSCAHLFGVHFGGCDSAPAHTLKRSSLRALRRATTHACASTCWTCGARRARPAAT